MSDDWTTQDSKLVSSSTLVSSVGVALTSADSQQDCSMHRTTLAVAALCLFASSAEAQRLLPGRFGAAVYGGISYPTGTFGDEANLGWHGGAYLEAGLYAAIDLRLD